MRELLGKMARARAYNPDAASFAAEQIALLPPIPRAGVHTLAALFKLHERFDDDATTRWRECAFAPCRDFILLCDSLLTLAHYETPADDGDVDAGNSTASTNNTPAAQ